MWPFDKRSQQQTRYSDTLVDLIQAAAGAGMTADVTATAAVEAATGALSRAFASAQALACSQRSGPAPATT